MSDTHLSYERTIAFRAPDGLIASMTAAARSRFMKQSEFIRAALVEKISRDRQLIVQDDTALDPRERLEV
ncbi:hypothetical protein CHELA1G11_70032 [Hyphomicrobiales bacterium]|nr:hypothetical protein CHELA1G2_60018 [Hyphomicrobiales bacterium]CAH1696926.1 hypothetical protein CHELA1G11_70032 [Hyphomicrobiales bacterium]